LEHRWSRAGNLLIHARVSANRTEQAKPAVVLVHGLGVSGRYLKPTARLLEPYYRVYLPDLPGFGQSEKPWPVLNLAELAQILADWLDTQGIEQAHFYAHSLGCQVMAHFAVRHPARVASLVMGGPTVDRCHRNWWDQLGRLVLNIPRESPVLLWIVLEDYLVCGPARLIATGLFALADALEDRLPRITRPVLVVRGAADPIASQTWVEEVAALLPAGRWAVIPGAAHAINYSAPVQLAGLIHSLIEETSDICYTFPE
jgi:2-hydroxy-6-oxonona-2,4-dienedioate hydrolase